VTDTDGLTPQRFENLLVKMYDEDKPQFVTVSIGGDLTNTEDFVYDGMVFFYFENDAELTASLHPSWDGGDNSFYTLTLLDDKAEAGDYKPYIASATLISNLEGTVWARSQEEAQSFVDGNWIVDDFEKVGGEFTLDEVYEA
jgi:hypothetical protein